MNELTLQQAADNFIKAASSESRQTGQSYRTGLNHFLAFLAGLGISPAADVCELRLSFLRDFSAWLSVYKNERTGRPLAKNTRSLYLIAASLFLRRLIGDKLLDEISLQDYITLRDDLNTSIKRDPIKKKLPPAELVDAILVLADIEPEINPEASPGDRKRTLLAWLRNRAIVYCLHSSGARVGELVNLARGDLREADGTAWVTGKGDKAREVRFSSRAWKRLNAYLASRGDGGTGLALSGLPVFCRHDRAAGKRRLALTARSVEALVARLAGTTGLAGEFHMHPHSFRHYFATRFLQHTGDLALTQDALGHEDPATTRIYADTDKEDIKRSHWEIFG